MIDNAKYIEENKKKWMNENNHLSKLMGPSIIPLRPDLGYFMKVQDLDISADFFPEEFNTIREAYFSVMKKLDEYKEEKI